jgi:hypothetical protein
MPGSLLALVTPAKRLRLSATASTPDQMIALRLFDQSFS